VSSVAAVVVSFEARDHLQRCLASLGGEEVVVVDNASSDGSAALVREHFPTVRLLALERNIGFGAACNRAVEDLADAELILLLNPDTILRPGAIERLAACIDEAPDIALVAPSLENADGSTQLSVLPYPGIFASGRVAVTAFPKADTRPSRERDLVEEYPVGAAMLVRRAAFVASGGFDPGFFHFYEELDLCKRLVQAGWRIRLCPRAQIEHVGGGSSTSRWAGTYVHQLRGHLRYVGKYRGRAAAEVARALLVAALLVRLPFARGEQRRGFVAGLKWLLRADISSVLVPSVSA
jgi:N-acetylglucosaminyl-diphospho-decaprenol L-rhamnosyltransferase